MFGAAWRPFLAMPQTYAPLECYRCTKPMKQGIAYLNVLHGRLWAKCTHCGLYIFDVDAFFDTTAIIMIE